MYCSSVPLRLLLALALGALATISLSAATYYVDPSAGKMSNPGTADKPWSTLEAVFSARKTFAPGDVILLRNGYHGFPVIRGHNTKDVTIKAQSGHKPKLRRVQIREASRWILSDLDISPLHAGATKYDKNKIVDIMDSASRITIKDCHIRSVFGVAGYTESQWNSRFGTAIASRAPYTVVTGNLIQYVAGGIFIEPAAEYSVVAYNVIESIRDDGLRALSSNSKFEYNTVKNVYAINGNHDDGLQSFTTGGKAIRNVEVRGNVFISYTDPKQPYKSEMQGIGCFDGMFENWVVENNVVVTDKWHGIAFYGAKNCRIVNNTVVKNPINARNHVPWIYVGHHKNGTRSSGNIVRNNITPTMKITAGTASVDSNLLTEDYDAVFQNWKKFDLRLKAGSKAINAGQTGNAPKIDAELNLRLPPFDLGALEFLAKSSSGSSGGTSTNDKPKSAKPAPVKEPAPSKKVVSNKGAGDPKFSVGAGSYSSARTVAIKTATQGATIRYTTDGSTPTESRGQIYKGTIRVDRNLTIKAIAYKSGMKPSSVKSATYRIKNSVAAATKPPEKSPGSAGSTADEARVLVFETDRLDRRLNGSQVTIKRQPGASGGQVLYVEAKKPGRYIELTTGKVPAGKYAVKLRIHRGSNRGQHSATIGSQSAGTLEAYAPSSQYATVSLGEVEVRKAGPQKVRLTVTGKHPRSRSYVIAPDSITFASL